MLVGVCSARTNHLWQSIGEFSGRGSALGDLEVNLIDDGAMDLIL